MSRVACGYNQGPCHLAKGEALQPYPEGILQNNLIEARFHPVSLKSKCLLRDAVVTMTPQWNILPKAQKKLSRIRPQ